jgi:hypothetical protein
MVIKKPLRRKEKVKNLLIRIPFAAMREEEEDGREEDGVLDLFLPLGLLLVLLALLLAFMD